jgi:flagellar biosynthesis GTPase FlhF
MARIALTKEEVMAAFEKLLAEGTTPSAENIHGLLGKGSIGAINRYIKEIIDENNQALLNGRNAADAPKTSLTADATLDLPFDASARDVGNEASPAPEPSRINENLDTHHFEVKKRRPEERRTEPEIIEAPIESLSEENLAIKVRRLESMLLKEQARREASERTALETQTYADSIKEQVSERISDTRQTMEIVIEQLKHQLKEQKQNYETDLKFYREQLEKANKKLTELLG